MHSLAKTEQTLEITFSVVQKMYQEIGHFLHFKKLVVNTKQLRKCFTIPYPQISAQIVKNTLYYGEILVHFSMP